MIPCPPPQPAPVKKGLTAEAVRAFYLKHGYKPAHNVSAHIYKELALEEDGKPKRVRICISRVAVRKEAEVRHTLGGKTWVRLYSGYLKDLWFADDKLQGLSRKGCQ